LHQALAAPQPQPAPTCGQDCNCLVQCGDVYAHSGVDKPAADIDEAEISRMTERGAKAWAGVDAQALREGGQVAPQAGEVTDEQIIELAVSCNLGRTLPPLGNPCGGDVFATDRSYRTDELLTFARAILALRPQADHPDTQRCINARNALNAALHGEGALIDDLEHAVANACAKLTRPQAVPMTDTCRALNPGERIEWGDECLKNDCVTWEPLSGWEVGMFYNPTVMVPLRRRVNGITAQGEGAKNA
ncbi:MAG TPA: hypothetical protein VFH49_09455, partial [Aquabacterium sp.]|nr:hypothetical protein [Aquabacterium sp.]